MFKKLPSPPDMLAYSVDGKLTAKDIDDIYEECLTALDENDAVHIYVEALDDFDVTGEAVWRDLARAHEMFGHFHRFDRIAFVAKPSWIRRIAKLEEAVLSLFNFNMHVFDPSERSHAMAWAMGEVEEANTPSIREVPSGDPGIAIIEIDGKIRKGDIVMAKQLLSKFQNDDQPRRLMAVITKFSGFEIALLADREMVKMKLEAAKHLDRYAFVGAPGWLEGYIETMDTLLKTEMRTFDADEREEAMAWLKEDALVS